MAERRKPGQYTIGSRAVAVAIMAEVVADAAAAAFTERGALSDSDAALLADQLVAKAWDVEYKPNAERLVMIVDASITSDRSRDATSDPETAPEPDTQ